MCSTGWLLKMRIAGFQVPISARTSLSTPFTFLSFLSFISGAQFSFSLRPRLEISYRFSKQMPSAFRSVPGVFYAGSCLRFSDVLGAALPSRLGFSIVDTFAYSRVTSEHFYSPSFGSHVFRGGGIPTCTVAAGNDLALLGCITTCRCCYLIAGLHCPHRQVLISIDVMHERGQGNFHFPCSADHEQDWQSNPRLSILLLYV